MGVYPAPPWFACSFLSPVSFLLLWLLQCVVPNCQWQIRLYTITSLTYSEVIFHQHAVTTVRDVLMTLTDQAVDPNDENSNYQGFPYHMRIDLACKTQGLSMEAVRGAFFSGLKVIITVVYKGAVISTRQKTERLQISMTGAVILTDDECSSEICAIAWVTPLPIINGTVVYEAFVLDNGVGPQIAEKRFPLNVHGFMRVNEETQVLESSIGDKIKDFNPLLLMNSPSRPLWFTHDVSPVLILGGVTDLKVILISATEFDKISAIEVSIDSCWIGSLWCPQKAFSATIIDAISTQSVLFIRQNQLVYYFTGNFTLLPLTAKPSKLWTRGLVSLCVEKLVPVPYPSSGEENLFVFGTGAHKGVIFLGRVRDGEVEFTEIRDSNLKRPCVYLKSTCIVHWATYSKSDVVHLLVEAPEASGDFTLISYSFKAKSFRYVYDFPDFLPKDKNKGYVMLLGTEEYTTTPFRPKGLAYNPISQLLFVWGNGLFMSFDAGHTFLYIPAPKDISIKYFAQSFRGEFIFVTDSEEVWYSSEGSSLLQCLRPSKAWNVFLNLQKLKKDKNYADKEALVTIFFDNKQVLQELVYIQHPGTTGILLKRKFPLAEILAYLKFSDTPYERKSMTDPTYIKFTQFCPFVKYWLMELPLPQTYSRIQHYDADHPEIVENTMFHRSVSLIAYQGLVYQLLWLHAGYNRPYGDPVHDPTWRWWKNKATYADYYFYVASNRHSSRGIFIEMHRNKKIYNLQPGGTLVDKIYMDKHTSYDFSIYLSISDSTETVERSLERSLDAVWLTTSISDADYAKIQDRGHYGTQSLSGEDLKVISILLKVVNAETSCSQLTDEGLRIQGSHMLPVYVGCPPGKRLAFDITYTLKYTTDENKRHFDCIVPDPEMPCFYYEDIFHPFFLIQDLVSGESGPFLGAYTFKVIGGGPYSLANIRYFSGKEITIYNTDNSTKPSSRIWMVSDRLGKPKVTKKGFTIFQGTSNNIMWICDTNSPCADILAVGVQAPDYYFVIEVSNRGVDDSTYCDYALKFVIHVHGLPLSPWRAFLYASVTFSVLWAILLFYIFFRCTGRWMHSKMKLVISKFKPASYDSESVYTGSEGSISQERLQMVRGQKLGIKDDSSTQLPQSSYPASN
nr:PREDICTED: cation channel sperm-associated protein subunit gamma isoform X3 [Latimeria chalumnae]|eukprot:XP_014348875.1 PREDICTED: cation channel sperm-associated protein subunit gamma isoform X3 [Latimeria chalumnae]